MLIFELFEKNSSEKWRGDREILREGQRERESAQGMLTGEVFQHVKTIFAPPKFEGNFSP